MFYIETNENIIFCKGQGVGLANGQIEVTEAFYNALEVPSIFELIEGEISNIQPILKPLIIEQPTEIELLQQRMELMQNALDDLILGGM